MGELVCETARLRLRRWIDADLPAIEAVYGDAQAMRFVGDGRPLSAAQARQWLSVTATNYELRGYGMFAVELRGLAGAIGFCGLVHPGGQPEAELKYAFAREHWGCGYATEAARGLLAHAHEAFGLQQVIATVAPGNRASQHVLRKAGFADAGVRAEDDGSETQMFSWAAPGANQARR